MEPPETPELPVPAEDAPPPAPPDPLLTRVTTDVTDIMDRAYLERLSRTEPVAFMKFASAMLNLRARPGGAADRGTTVVNVVNAIPRSPLDGMPPGFTYK
jgi:hypothetical protein